MTNNTQTRLLLLMLAAALAGCDGGSAPSPSAPSPTPPSVSPDSTPRAASNGSDTYYVADVILSGVVYEVTPLGRVPIEGVNVRLDYFHVFATPDVVTDSDGFFSFGPVWICPCSWALAVDAGITAVWVNKEGYEVVAGESPSVFGYRLAPPVTPDSGLRDVPIDGDTQVEIQLVRR